MEAGHAKRRSQDPRHHTQRMQKRLADTVQHLRDDVGKVDEPQLKAMFEHPRKC